MARLLCYACGALVLFVTTMPLATREAMSAERSSKVLGILLAAQDSIGGAFDYGDLKLSTTLRAALDHTPSARAPLARIRMRFDALNNTERVALVGEEMAVAIESRRLGAGFADRAFRAVPGNRIDVKLLGERGRELAIPRTGSPSRKAADRESIAPPTSIDGKGGRGREPSEGNSVLYDVDYRGIYIVDEDDDWGWHSEYFVIMNMVQGGSVWTRYGGEYGSADSGDKFARHWCVRCGSPFNAPLVITTAVVETDGGTAAEYADIMQVATEAAVAYYGVTVPEEVADLISSVAADLLHGLSCILAPMVGGDCSDDPCGSPQTILVTRDYARTHTASIHDDRGFAYDWRLHFKGGGSHVDVYFDVHARPGVPL